MIRACNPIESNNPFSLTVKNPGRYVMRMGGSVGELVGVIVGLAVGRGDGAGDGSAVGDSEEKKDGKPVGFCEGKRDGRPVGYREGSILGKRDGIELSVTLGDSDEEGNGKSASASATTPGLFGAGVVVMIPKSVGLINAFTVGRGAIGVGLCVGKTTSECDRPPWTPGLTFRFGVC
jgi:hypothetical protein